MPARNAERNALIQFLLRRFDAIGVHSAHELIAAIRRLYIKQGRGFERVEVRPGRKAVLVLGKVILRLRYIGEEDLIAVR
jgi:hypothetical protein